MIDIIINHFVEIIITLFSSVLMYIYRRLKKTLNVIDITKNSVVEIIRNTIINKYYYFMDKGCISMVEKEYINNLYREYQKLGGNNIIDSLMEDLNELEVTKTCH